MRLLEKNKRDIWYSYYIGNEEIIIDGEFTGEFEDRYTNTFKTKVNYIPVSSNIKQDSFGEVDNIDMILVTDKNVFDENTVVFTYEPNNYNIAENYEYKVSKIIKSINSYTIGLKKRV